MGVKALLFIVFVLTFFNGCDFVKISPKALVFKTTDGEKVGFRPTSKQRHILFHFWATWCSICLEELPSFLSFTQVVKTRAAEQNMPLEIVFVAMRDQVDRVKEFDDLFGIQSLTDPLGSQLGKYGVFTVPATFLVNSKLQIVPIPDPADRSSMVKVVTGRNWALNDYPEFFVEFVNSLSQKR